MPASSATPTAARAQIVHRLARELGFALVGIAPAEPTARPAELRQWLAEGRHGDMDYLAARLDELLDVRKLVPGARSVICVADRIPDSFEFRVSGFELPEERGAAPASTSVSSTRNPKPETRNSPPAGRIARYAWGDDYHWVIKRRLHELADALRGYWPEHEYRSCVDTAPLLEREYAQRAALGWIGKHTLLLHPQEGSWLMLGEIVTTLALQTAADAGATVTDHCGACTRCLDACPTRCITPYQVDARRCISYLTIEHHGLIDPDLHEEMGDHLAGCDVCQEVCPYNKVSSRESLEFRVSSFESGEEKTEAAAGGTASSATRNSKLETRNPAPANFHPAYTPRPPAPALPLLDVLGWDAAARERACVKSALKRLKLDQFKRNALIAAGNHLRQHDDLPLRQRIAATARDPAEPELVRATAQQVLARIGR